MLDEVDESDKNRADNKIMATHNNNEDNGNNDQQQRQ